MFVLVVGGGKVGYYLTKELIASGHEVVLMEKDRGRADTIADEIGSVVIPQDGCEGKYLHEAGANRADIVAAVTGDDEDNLVICQMAKHHFSVKRTIARVNNPKNELLFRHLGVDEIISPTRMVLGSIEQDIPVHELLHLADLGSGDLELIEALLTDDSPAIGKASADLPMPEGCTLFAYIRSDKAQPVRSDTVFRAGDKVIVIGPRDCEDALHGTLIGTEAAADVL
jgi:trk system potassium uptake protein TrkA